MRRYITILALAAAALGVMAQDLHKEIEIDRDIDPVETAVAKPGILPTLSLPALRQVVLNPIEMSQPVGVIPAISFLEPSAYADSLYVSPYRGYIAGGISPTPFSGTLAAGYRILDTDRVRLSAWLQFNSANYKKQLPWSDYSRYWRQNTGSAGIDFRWAVGERSMFKTAVDYTYDRYLTIYNQPAYIFADENATDIDRRYYQTINLVNVALDWTSGVDALNYNVSLGFNHTGAGEDGPKTPLFYLVEDFMSRPIRQNTFNIAADATLPLAEKSFVGLDLGLDIIRTSRYTALAITDNVVAPVVLTPWDGDTRGLFTITPRYKYTGKSFTANIGARIQFSHNSGNTFNLTPDVTLGWTPMALFAMEARFNGGVETNTLKELYGVTPFFNPAVGYQFSRVPLDADVKALIGPFHGAYLQLRGGYSTARRWLMPYTGETGDYSSAALFLPTNIEGWRYGAEIGYNWREKVIAAVNYTGVPGNDSPNRGYYRWRDRARHELGVNFSVKPVDRLTFSASYTLRAGRRIIDPYLYINPVDESTVLAYRSHRLHNISDLNLGITYTLSDPLSLFLRGENLLNHNTTDIALRPMPGIAVYVGASYQF